MKWEDIPKLCKYQRRLIWTILTLKKFGCLRSIHDHFGKSLIFCSEITFSKLFSKFIFKRSRDSLILKNDEKFEKAVEPGCFARQNVQNKPLDEAPLTLKLVKLKSNVAQSFIGHPDLQSLHVRNKMIITRRSDPPYQKLP